MLVVVDPPDKELFAFQLELPYLKKTLCCLALRSSRSSLISPEAIRS